MPNPKSFLYNNNNNVFLSGDFVRELYTSNSIILGYLNFLTANKFCEYAWQCKILVSKSWKTSYTRKYYTIIETNAI